MMPAMPGIPFSTCDFLVQSAPFPHVVSHHGCPFVEPVSWTNYHPAKYCNVPRSVSLHLCDAHSSTNFQLGSFGSADAQLGCAKLGGSQAESSSRKILAVPTEQYPLSSQPQLTYELLRGVVVGTGEWCEVQAPWPIICHNQAAAWFISWCCLGNPGIFGISGVLCPGESLQLPAGSLPCIQVLLGCFSGGMGRCCLARYACPAGRHWLFSSHGGSIWLYC